MENRLSPAAHRATPPAMKQALEVTPELLRSHADALRALARRLLRDDDAAEDVLQDTWLVALRHPPARQDSLGGWLRAVTRSLALKRLRGESRRARREEQGARGEAVPGPAESLAADERAQVVRSVTEAVLGLEEPYRSTVLRRYFEDLPPREIAKNEGVPVSTVKSRLTRAFARLRERLGRDLGSDGKPWKKTLAIAFGMPLPAPFPLAPTGETAPVAASSKPLSLTAIMAAKTSLLAIGAGLSLVALLMWRVSNDPAPSVRQPLSTQWASDLDPADLADVEAIASDSGDELRQELQAEAPPSGKRIWPAESVPGPTQPYALVGLVVDENDLPLADAEIYLGPMGHTLNRVTTTDAGGRFLVRWYGRGSTMDMSFCAKSGSEIGSVQGLRLRGSGENSLRTVIAQGTVLPILLAEGGAQAGWTISFTEAEESETVVEGGTVAFVMNTPSTPLDTAPTALQDQDGFSHFVGLDDSTACPAGFYRHEGEVLRAASVVALREHQVRLNQELAMLTYREALTGELSVAVESSSNPHVEVNGVVVNSEGEGVPDVLIVRLGENGQAHEQTRTDDAGNFVLEELAPGEIRLRAGGGNHGQAFTSFVAGAGQALHWEPLLDRGREIRGRLVTQAGKPLGGWGVLAVAEDSTQSWSDITNTDEKGFFSVPNCPAQGVRLLFSHAESESPIPDYVVEDVWPDTTPEPFVVPDGELHRGGLSLDLLDAFGEPVNSARVRLWSVATRLGYWAAIENDEGRFSREGLPPGAYRVEVGSSRHGWLEFDNVWINAGEVVDLGVLAFPEPSRLAFELASDGEAGLASFVPEMDDLRLEIWHEHADVRRRVRMIDGIAPPPLLLPAGDYIATARTSKGHSTRPFAVSASGDAALLLRLGRDSVALEPAEFDPAQFEAQLASGGVPAGCNACHPSFDED